MIAFLTEDLIVGLLIAALFVAMCGACWCIGSYCFSAFRPLHRRIGRD